MLLESLKEDVFISDASGCVDVPPEISVHLEELIFSFDNIHISQHDRLFKLAESLQVHTIPFDPTRDVCHDMLLRRNRIGTHLR